jgi:hypothetical protein
MRAPGARGSSGFSVIRNSVHAAHKKDAKFYGQTGASAAESSGADVLREKSYNPELVSLLLVV